MTIKDGVSEQTLLVKLAEECSELSAACMKLVCIEREDFPTSVNRETAVDNILEEIADVSLSVLGVMYCDWYDERTISRYINDKRERINESKHN